MSKKRYAFFISSVVDSLKRERNAVADVISRDHVAIRSEKFIGNESSREIIQKNINQCHCYIGIFDKEWGTVPKKDNPDNLSITALEYTEAKELELPVFILVSSNKEKEKELDSFLKKIGELEKGENWNKYSTPEELSGVLASYIPELVNQIEKKPVTLPKINEKIIEHNQKYAVIDSLIDGIYEKPIYFEQIFKKIQNNNTWIIGVRGIGKSVVLKKITEKLQNQQKHVIFFRAEEIIDKRDFQNITKNEFGVFLDEFVKKSTKTKDLYIIIDSVETIARRTEAWNSFSIEITNLQRNKKIHTILSIRDSDYVAFPYQFKREWGKEIQLTGFTLSQVRKFLKKFKVKGKISDDLYEVLRTPFYLMILSSLTKTNKMNFSKINNSFQFLQEHYNRVIRNNERDVDLAEKKVALLSKTCQKMLELKQFKIPNALFPLSAQFVSLRSDGVIVEKNNSLEFFHHVYFDYLMSLKIIESGLISKFLKKIGTEIFLHSTIYFTLAYLQNTNQTEFIKNIEDVLSSEKISFYWKRVALEYFANLQKANSKEIGVLEKNIRNNNSLQVSFLEYVIEKQNPIWYQYWSKTLFREWTKDSEFKQGMLLSKYITFCLKGGKK